MNDTKRAEFEAYAAGRGYTVERHTPEAAARRALPPDAYVSSYVQEMWGAWQAALELAKEVP